MNNNKGSFEIVPSQDYVSIKVNGICDNSILKDLEDKLTSQFEKPIHHFIDCENAVLLSNEWIRFILKIQTNLKQNDKKLIFLSASANLLKSLRSEGVASAFTFAADLKEALVSLGLVVKKTLNTEFINPFLNATLHVLKVQTGIEATSQKIYLKKEKDFLTGDVSGVIAIVSDSFCGSVVISFPEKTFLGIMSGMLGETYTELSKDIIDGAGEITNMIFGQAKTVLNEKGYGIKIAIPSVVTGKDHSLSAMTKGSVVVIPFTTSCGDFFVEVGLSD